MKQQDIDYIKQICNEKHSKQVWATRAQVMAKNIKPLKEACGDDGDIPFGALEEFLKSAVRKYDISVGQILTITDVTGEMTYHAGITTASRDPETKKSRWLFTVHADTLYELYIKLSLMTFVSVKAGSVGFRKKFGRR